MQTLPGIIQLKNGVGRWCGANGEHADTPRLTLALAAKLRIDLRTDLPADDTAADLAPYPFTDFADCASYYVAFDSDWDQLTIPPIKRFSGITVAQQDGRTIITTELPQLDSPAIRAAVKTAGVISLKGEFGGLDEHGATVFTFEFPILLKNRVYIPDGSSGDPTPDPSDPEYLTTAQVRGYILSELALAMAGLTLPEGTVGPPPIITIGDVSVGAAAAATLEETEPGIYALHLTLPRGADGDTPTPITPQLAIGNITSGVEADATLMPIPGTPGAFALNLTLPRGADGAGVNPSGPWDAATTYRLNDAVRHASAWWRSLHDDNLANPPPPTRLDNDHWEIIVKDGTDADPLLVNYNDTDDPDAPTWHLYRRSTDRFFRFTTDGGFTFSDPIELSQSPLAIMTRYNPDSTTDWKDLPAPSGSNDYHSTSGAFFRLKTSSGIWGDAGKIHDLDPLEPYRVQFGATPPGEDGAPPEEPDWHANFLPGDDRIIFFNQTGSIRMDIQVSLGEGESLAGVQTCPLEEPWHATYDPEKDTFWKISVDSGVTWTPPIPLQGKSAYDFWLSLGNTGSVQDFINSLRCPPSSSPGGCATITKLRLARPHIEGDAHLLVERAAEPDFSDAVTIIDTGNEPDDLARVLAYDGEAFVACPEGGLDEDFAGQTVIVDLSGLIPTAVFLRYKWIALAGDDAWRATFFPSSGEALVAASGGGEPPEPVDAGTLRVAIVGTDAGRWSVDDGASWHGGEEGMSLPVGVYTLTFKAVDGYNAPAAQSVTIVKGETLITYGQYTEAIDPNVTALRVHILGAAGQWSIDSGGTWNNSGATLSPAVGSHTVTFKAVDGHSAPADIEVTVAKGVLVERIAYYTAATAGASGHGVYCVGGEEPELLIQDVDLENSDIAPNATFNNLGVINGAIVVFDIENATASSLALGNQWRKAVGLHNFKDSGLSELSALAIDTDGRLWILGKQETDATISILRQGADDDWEELQEFLYAKKDDGSLWHYRSGAADFVKMGDHWDVSGKGFLTAYSTYLVTAGADQGKVFIGVDTNNDDVRQLGAAADWVRVSAMIGSKNWFEEDKPHKKRIYLVNSLGELHQAYNNSTYNQGTLVNFNISVSRMGVAANWVEVAGYSHPLEYSNSNKYYAFALNADGELYAIQDATLTYLGDGFEGATLLPDYLLKSNGQLYKLTSSTPRYQAPACTLQEDFDDWVRIANFGVAIRPLEPEEPEGDPPWLLLHLDGDLDDTSPRAQSDIFSNGSFATGKFNQGLELDSMDMERLSIPWTRNPFGGDFTISCWVKPTTTDRFALFALSQDCHLGIDTNDGTWNMWAGSGGSGWNILHADSRDNDPYGDSGFGSISVKQNTWQHIAFVHKDDEWMLFVDGELSVKRVREGNVSYSNLAARFGIWGNSMYYADMIIDEIRIDERALWDDDFTPPDGPWEDWPEEEKGDSEEPQSEPNLIVSGGVAANMAGVYAHVSGEGLGRIWEKEGDGWKYRISYDNYEEYWALSYYTYDIDHWVFDDYLATCSATNPYDNDWDTFDGNTYPEVTQEEGAGNGGAGGYVAIAGSVVPGVDGDYVDTGDTGNQGEPIYSNGTFYLVRCDGDDGYAWAVVADPSHNQSGNPVGDTSWVYFCKSDLTDGAMSYGGAGYGPPPYLTNNLSAN